MQCMIYELYGQLIPNYSWFLIFSFQNLTLSRLCKGHKTYRKFCSFFLGRRCFMLSYRFLKTCACITAVNWFAAVPCRLNYSKKFCHEFLNKIWVKSSLWNTAVRDDVILISPLFFNDILTIPQLSLSDWIRIESCSDEVDAIEIQRDDSGSPHFCTSTLVVVSLHFRLQLLFSGFLSFLKKGWRLRNE